MALGEHRVRDRGPHAPAADDQDEHVGPTLHPPRTAQLTLALGQNALAGALLARRRRGEDHLAGRLLDHVAGGLARRSGRAPGRGRRGSRRRARGWAPRRPARSPRRRAGAPRTRSPGPTVRPRTIAVATSTPSYSSPTSLARASTRLASCDPLVRHARVDRQRHRDLEHVERLEHRAALALLGVLGRQPAGGARRCRRRASSPNTGTRMLPYSASLALLERLGRDREALASAACPGRAGRPRRAASPTTIQTAADHARALVQHDHADPDRRPRTARPSTAGSGTAPPRTWTESGTRNALGRSASRKRSTITDRWAIANAIIAPKAKMPARKLDVVRERRAPNAISAGDRRSPRRACRGAGAGGRPRSGSGGWWRASRPAAPGRASGRSSPTSSIAAADRRRPA